MELHDIVNIGVNLAHRPRKSPRSKQPPETLGERTMIRNRAFQAISPGQKQVVGPRRWFVWREGSAFACLGEAVRTEVLGRVAGQLRTTTTADSQRLHFSPSNPTACRSSRKP